MNCQVLFSLKIKKKIGMSPAAVVIIALSIKFKKKKKKYMQYSPTCKYEGHICLVLHTLSEKFQIIFSFYIL